MSDQIAYFIQSNTYLFILWLIVEFGLKKSANYKFIRFYLLIGVTLSLLLPFLKFSGFDNISNTSLVSSALEEVSILGQESYDNAGINWLNVLFSVYLIGVLAQCLRFIHALVKIRQLYQTSRPVGNYREIPNSKVAFSFFKVVFLGSNLSATDKKIAFKHELIHAKKFHSIDLIIIELLTIVFWFNPIIYMIKQLFLEQHEFEADELSCTENRTYIELLLQQNFNAYDLTFIHQFNTNHLKSRIMRLTTNNTKRVSKWAVTISIIAFGVIFLSNCSTEDSELDQPVATKTSQKYPAFDIVKQPEKAAEFPGGKDALYSFIAENISYPEKAKKNQIEGTVYVQFIVSTQGNIALIKIISGVNEELNQAAVNVFKAMPQWEPAVDKGKRVNTLFTLPIKFKLPKK